MLAIVWNAEHLGDDAHRKRIGEGPDRFEFAPRCGLAQQLCRDGANSLFHSADPRGCERFSGEPAQASVDRRIRRLDSWCAAKWIGQLAARYFRTLARKSLIITQHGNDVG